MPFVRRLICVDGMLSIIPQSVCKISGGHTLSCLDKSHCNNSCSDRHAQRQTSTLADTVQLAVVVEIAYISDATNKMQCALTHASLRGKQSMHRNWQKGCEHTANDFGLFLFTALSIAAAPLKARGVLVYARLHEKS